MDIQENNYSNSIITSDSSNTSRYSPLRKKIFIYAILGNALIIFLPFVFGIMAWRIGEKELAKYPRDWMVRVGRLVGKIETFVSIGVVIYWAIYIVIIVSSIFFSLLRR